MNIKIPTLVFSAALFCCNSLYSAAATWTWQGGTSYDWYDKSNWITTDPASAPSNDDLVVIEDGSSTYPFLASDVTCKNFRQDGGYFFSANYAVTVIDDIVINDGHFNSDSSLITATNLIMNGGNFGAYGNKIAISDNVIIDGGFFIIFQNDAVFPDDLILRSGILDLNGFGLTVTDEFTIESGAFSIVNQGSTVIINNIIFDFTGIDTLDFDINVGGSATFTSGIVKSSSSAMLIFDNNATATGAKASSHVNGPVRRTVSTGTNTTFEFPVGNGSVFAPIEISGFLSTRNQDFFTAQYFKTNAPYNLSSKDVSLNHVGGAEYWQLDRGATAGTASTSVFVKLSYDENNRSGIVDNPSEIRVTKWDGSTWKDLGRSNATGNGTAGTLTTTSRVSTFSPFTLGSTTSLNPLPVTLINFAAVAADKFNKISWSTVSEKNNDFFTVQKSLDGKSWSVIGIVDGMENSATVQNYSLKDMSPVKGVQFYRLMQTDLNGKSTYSNIVMLNILPGSVSADGNIVMGLYPNPVINTLNLTLSAASNDASIVVFNSMGMKVMELNNLSGSTFALDMTEFEKGIYTVEIRHDNGVNISKVLKN
jgi:hypothetical protein